MSRVWTSITLEWDENIHEYVCNESRSSSFEYSGPVACCKESEQEKQNRMALNNAQTQATLSYYNEQLPWERNMAQQQMDLYNKTTQAQLGFENTALTQQQAQYKQYMDMMNAQFGKQDVLSKTVTDAMSPYLTGDKGYSDAQMSALNDQGMSSLSSGYSDAASQIRQMLLAHGEGGGQPLGGNAIANMAELQGGLANNVAGMRNANMLQNFQQALQNKFNAAGVVGSMAGQAAGIGTSAMGAGDSALNSFGALGSQYGVRPVAGAPGQPQMAVNPNTKQPGFLEKLSNGLIGGLSNGISAGIGGLMSGGMDAFSGWLGGKGGSSASNPAYI